MLKKRCELCGKVIPFPRAKFVRTKYCAFPCAPAMQRQKSLESFTVEDRKRYNKTYMPLYRKTHPRSTTSVKKSGKKTKRKPVLTV